MEAKHTTGEWMHFFNGNYFEVRGVEKATPNISIFNVSIKDHPNFKHYCEQDESEANAKLIAAAPNLLDACQTMIKAFKDAPKDWLMTNDVQQAESIMMDAINKAVSDK